LRFCTEISLQNYRARLSSGSDGAWVAGVGAGPGGGDLSTPSTPPPG